jgi:hypothetical protein
MVSGTLTSRSNLRKSTYSTSIRKMKLILLKFCFPFCSSESCHFTPSGEGIYLKTTGWVSQPSYSEGLWG